MSLRPRLRALTVIGRYWLAIKLLTWILALMRWNNAPLWLSAQVVALSDGMVEQTEAIARRFGRR